MIRLVTLCVIVFFKQKTAYELRISDWSSDVCSSDLNRALTERPELARPSIVVPRSCHPSIDKAAHYLGLEVRRVPISDAFRADPAARSEEHTSELQSLMRISYAVFCLKKKKKYQR